MTGDVILITGASGTVGSGLADTLVGKDRRVRLGSRHPERLASRWTKAEAVALDVLDPDEIAPALDGVSKAAYLVHSMEASAGSEFHMRDAEGARNFARAARSAGLERVVYLSGLGDERGALSEHLWSRQEVGRILAAEGPPVVEFRAAMVITPGSASFRMLTDFVHRLPAMILPKWAETPTQPIAGHDILAYLAASLDVPLDEQHVVVEVGMPEVLTYRRMIERVATRIGRSPLLIEVPLLTPKLSSYWAGLTTSVSPDLARPLIEGLTTPTIVRDPAAAQERFPSIAPMGFDEALDRALAQ